MVFSLIPLESNGPELIVHQDKLIHLICYAVLSYLALTAIGKSSIIRLYFWSILFAILYGIGIEIAQALLNTGRYFDYFDIIANIIGSLLGSLVFYLIHKN